MEYDTNLEHYSVVLTDTYNGSAADHLEAVHNDVLDLTTVFSIENALVMKSDFRYIAANEPLTLDMICDHDFASMVANTQGVACVKKGFFGPVVEPKVL